MSASLHVDLAWLPAPPADFAQACRAALDGGEGLGRRLRWLASHRLDQNGLARLAATIKKAQGSLAPLTPFKLGLIGNATTAALVPALIATAARHGIALEVIDSEYGQMAQQALSPDSAINRAQADAVLLVLDHHNLPLRATPGDAIAARASIKACLAHIDSLRAGLHENGKTICLLPTIPRPAETLFGSLDAVLPGTHRHLLAAVNQGLAERAAEGPDRLLDVAGLAETVGLAEWHDPTLWNMAKLPCSGPLLPLYAEHVCRLIAALRGKSRRALILDLDNTLWGGVIGDDGVEGIVLGQGDPTGEAFLEVQRTALALRGRGVVLAVSSKNTDAIARQPFRRHPEMLLKEDHLAVFQANWNDKATNIKAIAEELALGLESLVFLDDNPVERGLVRQILPEVAIPELPEDPALYARTLLAAGYFEAVAFLPEDRQRAEFYQDNARRVALRTKAGDIDGYLASLDMVITFQPFDETGRSRIAQLIGKSNQFNLTTKRYGEAEVEAAQHDPKAFTLQIRLADAFGDNGMISVVICRTHGTDWEIDTWLMSCRVLGRKVEQAVLQELGARAKRQGIRRLVGRYLPTERNALVADHYAKLGFAPVETLPDGATVWEMMVEAIDTQPLPMQVRHLGFDTGDNRDA
jgi:FkbH-like protein